VKNKYLKNSLFLQITNGCNLNCTFCSEGRVYVSQPFFESEEFVEKLATDFKQLGGKRIVLTGGEPTLHVGLGRMVNKILSLGLKVKIDTNGTILFKNYKRVLSVANTNIQCSLEGGRKQTNSIRGKNVFSRATENLGKYVEAGFTCNIKLTLVPTTCRQDIKILAEISRDLGLSKLKLGIVKYVGGAESKSFRFETRKFVDLLKCVPDIQREFNVEIELCDYVPFLPWLKKYYAKACKGIHNYFVFTNGVVVPCRFLDNVVLGNVKKESLIDIFERGSVLDNWKPPRKCKKCRYLNYCGGGCRYRALKYKNINSPDPACFYSCGTKYLPL